MSVYSCAIHPQKQCLEALCEPQMMSVGSSEPPEKISSQRALKQLVKRAVKSKHFVFLKTARLIENTVCLSNHKFLGFSKTHCQFKFTNPASTLFSSLIYSSACLYCSSFVSSSSLCSPSSFGSSSVSEM